jgi:AcrR family transcriptional regulator
MALKKSQRKETMEIRRDSILRAARCVFARQGFADTVVDDIADQAGIGKGTLYLYFRSKEDIYMAALLEDARRLNTATRERMQQVGSWQEQLRAYVTVRMEHLETNQDFLRIYLAEFRGMMMRNARIHCELYQVMRESEGLLAQAFAAAIARGEVREVDPELAAMTVVDLTRGLMERRLLGASCATNPDEIEFALDLLCRSLEKDGSSTAVADMSARNRNALSGAK